MAADRPMVARPVGSPEAKDRVGITMSKTWSAIPDSRRDLLRLLSRFDLTIDQATRMYQETERAKAGITLSDADILANPTSSTKPTVSRSSRSPYPAIDRGVFPADQIRTTHPLPSPSRVDEAVDPRRVRALVVDVLEEAAVSRATRCGVRGGSSKTSATGPSILGARSGSTSWRFALRALPPEVATVSMANGEPAFQLERLHEARRAIPRQVERRRQGRVAQGRG